MAAHGFRFGLEGEYLLVEQDSFQPLWHPDLSFAHLNSILESIRFQPLIRGLSLDGLELDRPHRRLMPYYVEGYGMPDPHDGWCDVLPKGLEIRTPVCPSLDVCLDVYEALYQKLQDTLGKRGYRAVALAHHPTAWEFRGPQNSVRHDWWVWGMRAMTTYGPDLNLSLPEDRRARFDWERLLRRVNYYSPALTAFSLASPVGHGRLVEVRGRPVLSLRTYRRSPFAPAVAAHPKEGGRLELKVFDMPADRGSFRAYFLLWLWLATDERAPGQAEDADRIYSLGEVARLGWDAPDVAGRAEEALDGAARWLARLGVDPGPLGGLRLQLQRRRTPAEVLIRQMKKEPSIPALLHFLDRWASAPSHAFSPAVPARVPVREPLQPAAWR